MSIRLKGVMYALLAALFYALNVPLSKTLLSSVPPVMMAAFLYLGAGAGVSVLYIFHAKEERKSDRLGKTDLPYVIGMTALDVAAPIFMMTGLKSASAANASLLGNFEIVATTLFAFMLFRENVSLLLWIAIMLVTLSSAILSFEGGSLRFSSGSLFVLLATLCWGFENNCTRSISDKSTYQIVIIKGLCSGTVSFVIALLSGEALPETAAIMKILALGFVVYGLSIFTYVRAQSILGSARTSAFYAAAPFISVILSFIISSGTITWQFVIAFALMAAGSAAVTADSLHGSRDKTKS
ncbi:MAG: DMT family transporter [Bullifex sp.]